jgi:nucleotide-binding universal stress UspA family protein
MSDTQVRPIVVGTDGSLRAGAAVTRAAVVASSRGARLHVVCAHRLSDSGLHRDERRSAPHDVHDSVTPRHEALETAAEGVAAAVEIGADATGHATLGGPAWALRELAAELNAALIVVGAGSRRSLLARLFARTVDVQLTRDAPCQIVVVHEIEGPIVKGPSATQTREPRARRARTRPSQP